MITRVIIYKDFVELEYIMLHAKFQDHGTISSKGEDFFLCFLPKNGHGGYLGHVTWTIYINFLSPFSRRLEGVDWPSGFREEDV